jgi:hypothetical protein
VSDALDQHRPITVDGTYLARVSASEISGRLVDPDTSWPFYTVRIEAYAGDRPIA